MLVWRDWRQIGRRAQRLRGSAIFAAALARSTAQAQTATAFETVTGGRSPIHSV
jgi:hypothetical protein